MAPVGLKHWMLHNDQLANEYDETLKLSPGYDPVRAVDPALTFHAPLLTGPDSIAGAIRATFERNSEATYLAPRGAFLLTAGDDESRHEYTPQDEPLGVLMEPARTNKCENWNANPDAALTNIRDVTGTGTFERINQAAALRRAGLNAICADGNVIRITETDGASAYAVSIAGEVGNLNEHAAQIWARVIQGEGRLNLTGGGAPFTEFTNTEFELIELVKPPLTIEATLQVQAQPDSIVEFVLNELEESEVPSSIIVTKGAATSRAVDQLSWPLMGSLGPILNQSEGMLSIIFRPSFDNAQYPSVAPNNFHIVRFDNNNSIPIYYNKESGGTDRFGSWDDATIAEVDIPGGIDADVDYLVTLHWAPGARQLAFKRAGTWTRGTVFGFAGAWPIEQNMQVISMLSSGNEAQLPAHARELYIWNVNRGQAWLEDFFADLVN